MFGTSGRFTGSQCTEHIMKCDIFNFEPLQFLSDIAGYVLESVCGGDALEMVSFK